MAGMIKRILLKLGNSSSVSTFSMVGAAPAFSISTSVGAEPRRSSVVAAMTFEREAYIIEVGGGGEMQEEI